MKALTYIRHGKFALPAKKQTLGRAESRHQKTGKQQGLQQNEDPWSEEGASGFRIFLCFCFHYLDIASCYVIMKLLIRWIIFLVTRFISSVSRNRQKNRHLGDQVLPRWRSLFNLRVFLTFLGRIKRKSHRKSIKLTVVLWLRRQDSKRSPKFSFVLKGAYNLHYLHKKPHLLQMMHIFAIANFFVRKKIRETVYNRRIEHIPLIPSNGLCHG